MKFRTGLGIGIVVLLLFLSYRYFDSETETLSDRARAGASGSFIRLADGITHFEQTTSAKSPTVVLIHGGSVPYFVWDGTFADLADAGFHVLRYDLYGRGYSDRPAVVYNMELFRRQLNNLLDSLKITGPVDLVGISMGAGIAADFTDHFPGKVRRVCFINPVGFPAKLPDSEKLMHIPLLGEYIFTIAGPKMMISFIEKDVVSGLPPEYIAAYKKQMQFKGFRYAMISTLRNVPLNNMIPVYERIGKTDRDILLIWGTKDLVTPYKNSEKARSLMPRAKFLPVAGAGHAAHIEQPQVVNKAIIEFLRS